MKLEFGKQHFIHKIIIHYRFFTNPYNPSDHCVKAYSTFQSCVRSETDVDVSVYQGEALQKSCGTLQLTEEREQSDQIYSLFCNIKGNIVKLSKDTGDIIIREVAVIGTGEIYLLDGYDKPGNR